MTTTTKIAGEAMTDAEISEIAARIYGTLVTEQEFRFARALLASKDAAPHGFGEWIANPYTKTLMKSIESDYVPKPTAPAQSCGDAEQADAPQAVTTDDMEKAVRNSKWGKDIQSRNAFREGWKTALTALPRADEQADEAVTRDAERYRWMRDFNVRCKDGVDVKPPCEHVFASIYSHAVGTIPATRLVTGDELDRAIDAARAKDSK